MNHLIMYAILCDHYACSALYFAAAQTCAYKLQDAILSSRGVVRLMDMLAEKEAIRNEALVLLVSLTHSNEEVQKIAAFEGAFDRWEFSSRGDCLDFLCFPCDAQG